jgi:transposase InsO family protein
VLSFFRQQGIPLGSRPTDRRTEYCGQVDRHPCELYLALEDIEHTRTKTKSPQSNGICERFNKTLLSEFCRVAFRKRLYAQLGDLQTDLDDFLEDDNTQRPHQGRWCYGKTPMQTFFSTACR